MAGNDLVNALDTLGLSTITLNVTYDNTYGGNEIKAA
jgi:hypothetical protein